MPTTRLTHKPTTPIWVVFHSGSVCANETLINNALDHQFSFKCVFHATTLAPNLFLVHVFSVLVRREVLRCAPLEFSNFKILLFDSFDHASQTVRSVPLPTVFEPDSFDPSHNVRPTHCTSLLGPHSLTRINTQNLSPLNPGIHLTVLGEDSTASSPVDQNPLDGLGHVDLSASLASPVTSPRNLSNERKQKLGADCAVPSPSPPSLPSSLNPKTLDHPPPRPLSTTDCLDPLPSPQPPPGRLPGLLDLATACADPKAYPTVADLRDPSSLTACTNQCLHAHACAHHHVYSTSCLPYLRQPTHRPVPSASSRDRHGPVPRSCHSYHPCVLFGLHAAADPALLPGGFAQLPSSGRCNRPPHPLASPAYKSAPPRAASPKHIHHRYSRKQKPRCFRCLASDHTISDCRDPVRCSRCWCSGHRSFRCKAVRFLAFFPLCPLSAY